jgi:hypothetical protein
LLHLVPLLAPLVLMLAAFVAFRSPGFRPRRALRVAEGAALVSVAVAVGSAAILVQGGAAAGPGLGLGAWAVAPRLDAVSAVMLLLVASIGWVVLRYSATYLDGEARQGAFTGWMALTLAAVMLLVTAGTLLQLVGAWIATSLALHKLLLFFPERVVAQRAARKKVGHGAGGRRCADRRGRAAGLGLRHGRDRGDPGCCQGRRNARTGGLGGWVPRARGASQVGAVPAAWLAARGHGDAHAGLRASPCGGHQRGWLPPHPLCRRDAAGARRACRCW